MPPEQREITRDDILSMDEFGAIRKERQAALAEVKKRRRVDVGPFATFIFESYETMWMQVHEMLAIEGGGEAQIAGELDAYNPLIPKGREFVATLMFEIDDPDRRAAELGRLGGVEHTISLTIGEETLAALADADAERSTAEGRTSTVHFLHFPLSDAQAAAFRDPAQEVVLGFGHPNYAHMSVLGRTVREELANDLD